MYLGSPVHRWQALEITLTSHLLGKVDFASIEKNDIWATLIREHYRWSDLL